jgi:hypothetical protein
MYMDIEMGHPQRLTSAVLVTHTPVFRVRLEIYGLDVEGQWHLSPVLRGRFRAPQDFGLEAARRSRRARYLLAPTVPAATPPSATCWWAGEVGPGARQRSEAGASVSREVEMGWYYLFPSEAA